MMAGPWEPLRHKPFRYLVAGRIVSSCGGAIAPLALAFAVLDLTGSVSKLGLVVGARTVANVVFLLVGGVIADRLPRRLIMIVSSALAALTQAAVATLVITHQATVGSLMVLGALNGIVSAFAMPASSAVLAQTVPAGIRKQAVAINRLAQTSINIGGAAIGGVLIAFFTPGPCLALDAITFAVAAVLFAGVRVAQQPAAAGPQQAGMLRELRVGWREFVANTWVWVVVLGFCFYNAAISGVLGVLAPAIADKTFGRTGMGLVLGAEAVGMALGALYAMRVNHRYLLRFGVLCTSGCVGLLISLALSPRLLVLLPVAFGSGLMIEQFGVAWEASMTEHIAADKLARVYSYDAVGSFVAIPIGQVAAGPIAVATSPKTAVLIAAGIAGLSVLGMLLSRSVRTLAHEPKGQPQPPEPTLVAAS